MKKKYYKVGISLLIVVVLLISLVYVLFFRGYKMNIYFTYDGRPCSVFNYCARDMDKTIKIKSKTKDAKVVSVAENGEDVLIKDDVMKIYNIKTKKTQVIKDIPAKYVRYILQTLENDDTIYGIVYFTKSDVEDFYKYNDAVYYNLLTKEKMYEGKYTVMTLVDKDKLLATSIDLDPVILNPNKEEILYKEVKEPSDKSIYIYDHYYDPVK